MDLYRLFITTLRLEALLIYRHYSQVLNPLLFYAMTISLFPLGLSPQPQLLHAVAPGVLWIVALLSILLSLHPLFEGDFADGTLEQLLLSPQPLSIIILAKLLAHWLLSVFPLILLALLFAPLLHLPLAAMGTLFASLLLGTPVLLLIGAIGKALTLGIRNSSLLVMLLVLPFYIPVLILGAGSVALAGTGLAVTGELAWLGAMLVLALPLAPLAIAAALRVGIN